MQPILSPNRKPVFTKLAQEPELDVKLFLLNEKRLERPGWDLQSVKDETLKCKAVKSIDFKVNLRCKDNTFTEPYRIPIMLWSDLFDYRPDVIMVSNATEALFCLPFKVLFRTSLGIISGDTLRIATKMNMVSQQAKKLVYKSLDIYCAYGEETENYLIDIGIRRNQIWKTFWAVDNNFFSDSRHKRSGKMLRKALKTNRYLFLTVGQLIERKGFLNLLDAWKQLPVEVDNLVSLLIVGSGVQKQRLLSIVDQQGLRNVLFMDHVMGDELAACYCAADIFIFPTLEDIWGLVVNEAMVAGLPILCSEHAGCVVELVKDGTNGFVFDPFNETSIRSTILKSIAERERWSDMGLSSQAIISRYTFDRMVDQLKSAIISARNY